MEKYTVLMDDKIQHSYYVNSAKLIYQLETALVKIPNRHVYKNSQIDLKFI